MVDNTNTRGNTTQKNLLTLEMYMGPSKNKIQSVFLTVFLYTRQRTGEEESTFCTQKKTNILCFPLQMITERLIRSFLPYNHLQQGTSRPNAPSPCVCRKRSHYFPFWKFAHTHTFGILGILNNLNWPENKTQNFVSNITRFCSRLKCF